MRYLIRVLKWLSNDWWVVRPSPFGGWFIHHRATGQRHHYYSNFDRDQAVRAAAVLNNDR